MTSTKTVKEAIESLQQNPSDDIWNRLDAALQEIDKPSLPPDSFTRKDFQAKYHISESQAKRRIDALTRAGKITKQGNGNSVYYILVK